MLGDIIRELMKINDNEKIASKNVLSWAKRVEVQIAQSTIMNSLTEAKEFDKLKVVKTYTGTVLEGRCRQRHLQNRLAYVVAAIPPDNAWHMGRHAQSVAKLATSEWFAEAGEPEP